MATQAQQPLAQPSKVASTYVLVTAENILKKYGVALTREELAGQIFNPHSLYREILRLHAPAIYNQMLLVQNEEIEYYCRKELTDIAFAHQVEMGKGEEGHGLSAYGQDQLQTLQNKYASQTNQLEALQKKQNENNAKLDKIIKEELQKWNAINAEYAKKITQSLIDSGMTLSENFEKRLTQKLQQSASGVEIDAETLKRLKLKGAVDPVNKAIITTLLEESRHG